MTWGQKGGRKGAQREAKRGTEAPEGVPRSRVRGPVRPRTKVWPHFGAIFDEKNDKKAMRSYTVFKYPKMVVFWMKKRCRNEAKK